MHGLQLKMPLRWMIWGYPYFRKPSYIPHKPYWSYESSYPTMGHQRHRIITIEAVGLERIAYSCPGQEACAIKEGV